MNWLELLLALFFAMGCAPLAFFSSCSACCASGSGSGGSGGSIAGCCSPVPATVTATITGACCSTMNQTVTMVFDGGSIYDSTNDSLIRDCIGAGFGLYHLRFQCTTGSTGLGWYFIGGGGGITLGICQNLAPTQQIVRFTILSCDPFHMIAVITTFANPRCCAGTYTIEVTE
jgi:hypothetical protein